ncbi:AAA family ATPase [Aliarcobacter butzleri]|uniref:AAA family ATPase n=2 Tax=Aliarcobacter butzleri TaxID=28197 RepID=UPI0028758740|nr:AAA family ATPase [Aliarcobacter butzleri]MDS1314720.1 AAA family ATPase [Aliarcobacter butzleri]
MELVYLWVQSYKNIEKQGFNFSPRFRCEYDEEKNELTINENKDYVSIFPDNINITAIVGENGSGKSSIFEVLTFLYYQGLIVNRKDKTFFLFYKNNQFFVQCENYKKIPLNEKDLENFIKIRNNTLISVSKNFCARCDMPLIHFSNCISDITNNYSLKALKNYDKFYNGIQPTKPLMKSKNSYDNFNQKFQYVLKKDTDFFNFINETFIFDSYQCEIQFQEIEVSIVQYDNKEFGEYISFQKKKCLNNEELLYKMLIVLAIEMTMGKIHNSRHHSLEPNTANAEVLRKYIKENIEDKLINKIDDFHLSSLKFTLEICNNSLKKIEESISEAIFDINLFSAYSQWEPIKPMNNFHELMGDYEVLQSNTILQSKIFKMQDNYLETVYSNELLNFMMNNNILRCNFLNSKKNNCHFLELSSGEKLFLNVLTNFSYTLFRLPDDYSGVMLFDEIELSLHPNWQKRLLKSFISIQDKLSKSKRLHLHLIFTSHSPFILSDLPKENVIFLKNGKQDNPDIKQTFGANIHTLLSHGFFMKDGLMGEFAKDKINQVYNFITDNDTSFIKIKKEAQNIINLIGEPMLKKELQFLYDEKFEIDDIDKQIREHEEAIEKLKSKKKKND